MLDLFDLDEAFSSEKVRLAQLTNKCKFSILPGKTWLMSRFRSLKKKKGTIETIFGLNWLHSKGTDDDLEFYVRKCGEILGVTPKLEKDQNDAKHILEHIFFQVVEFKKLNQVRES